MFQKIRSVIYHVSDLALAKVWYSQLLDIVPYFDELFYVGFNINGFELGLDPDMTGIIEGNHTCALWAVNNIDAVIQKALTIDATIVQPKTQVGENMWVAKLADKWGNHIGLIEENT